MGWCLTRPTGAQWLWSPDLPALSILSCPHPPDPLPRRGRGRPRLFLCKGLRPLHPRGLNPGGAGMGWRLTRPERAEAGCYNKFEESSGGSGGLFQESPGASLPLASPGAETGCYNKFEESSGGSGGLFQESPGVSPPAGCPECGEITGFFQTRGSRRAGSFGYR